MGRLEEIVERWQKATAGPWTQSDSTRPNTGLVRPNGPGGVRMPVLAECFSQTTKMGDLFAYPWAANAEAIAHAPEDIAYLLAEVRKARICETCEVPKIMRDNYLRRD